MIKLTKNDAKILTDAIENPPPPNKKLMEASKQYKQQMKRPDQIEFSEKVAAISLIAIILITVISIIVKTLL